MSILGDDLIQAMTEALAQAKGEGPPLPAGSAGTGADGPTDGQLRLLQKEPDVVKRALLT